MVRWLIRTVFRFIGFEMRFVVLIQFTIYLFSFGLGVLVKCSKQKYGYLVNQEFDSLLKSKYYE